LRGLGALHLNSFFADVKKKAKVDWEKLEKNAVKHAVDSK